MRRILAALLPSLFAAGAIAASPAQPATQPSPEAMQQRLEKLQARVSELQAQHDQRQAQSNAAVHAVLADAQAGLAPTTETLDFPSGWDPNVGFVLQDSTGQNSIHPSLLFQFRNVTTYRQKIPPGGGGETGASGYDMQNGFEMSRMRLILQGSTISSNLTYFIQFGDDAANLGNPGLLDAYVMYRVSSASPLALKIGQFKDPVFHEANLLPSNLMAADRSLVNQFLGGGQTGRVQGGEMIYDDNRLRDQLAFTDGYNTINTKFINAGGLGTEVGGGEGITPPDFGISGRAEYLLIGDRTPDYNSFSQYDQFTALGARQNTLVIGAGMDYSESGRDKIGFHTVDAQFDGPSGWGAYAAFLGVYREASTPKGAPGGSYYDDGFLLQTSYLVTPQFEPFVRGDYTYMNGKSLPGIRHDVLWEMTVGANYYIDGQRLKATVDFSWLPNGIPADEDMLGYLQDDNHNEMVLRAQLQLAI